jgi:ketosteroid isomerase-like protein
VQGSGDLAWVTVEENLLGDGGGSTVAALNLFRRSDDGRWLLVAHHGSPVASTHPG